MRGLRVLLAGLVLALIPAAASAQPLGNDVRFALRDINCQGLTVVGRGLPARTSVRLALVNQDSGRVMTRRNVSTNASGRFSSRLPASMNGVLGMRVLVRSKSGRALGFVDHTMTRGAAMCSLPYTGPFQPKLAVAGGVLVAAGAVLLLGTRRDNAYWPQHLAPTRRQRAARAAAADA